MKIIPTILFLFIIAINGFSQENSPRTWILEIDTTKFNLSTDIGQLTDFFLSAIGRTTEEIALVDSNFARGCLGPKKHTRLNWISNSENDIQFISLSYSGKATWTSYYISRKPEIYSITPHFPVDSILNLTQLFELIETQEYGIDNELE